MLSTVSLAGGFATGFFAAGAGSGSVWATLGAGGFFLGAEAAGGALGFAAGALLGGGAPEPVLHLTVAVS